MEKAEGILEVGCNDQHEIVINHPDLKPDENGVGHIVFSVDQARGLANTLLRKAAEAAQEIAAEQEAKRIAAIPPVDRSTGTRQRIRASSSPNLPAQALQYDHNDGNRTR